MCAIRKLTIRPQAQRESIVALPDLTAHLQENSTQLREEWVQGVTTALHLEEGIEYFKRRTEGIAGARYPT